MLNEFLLLGRVPWTNFQVTFTELVLILDISLVLFLLRKRHFITEAKYFWLYLSLYISIKKGQLLKRPAVLIERIG